MSRLNRILVLMVMPLLIVGLPIATSATAETIASDGSSDSQNSEHSVVSRAQVLAWTDVASLAGTRSDFGFDGTLESVAKLLGDSEARKSFSEVGVLLSSSERVKFDARISLENALEPIVQMAAIHSGFGGARLEHVENGVFHIYLTSDDTGAELESIILSKLPSQAVVRIHKVRHSQAHLISQMDKAWSALPDSKRGSDGLHFVGVDIERNGLVVELDDSLQSDSHVGPVGNTGVTTSGEAIVAAITSSVEDIPIEVKYSELPQDDGCNSLSDCANPMAGGIKIHKGSLSGGYCTLGFMVKNGSNTQVLTAGHCGWSGSNDWFHQGYGTSRFGYEVSDTAFFSNGRDGMILEIEDTQGSNDLAYCHWGVCQQITGYKRNTELFGGMILNSLGARSGLKTGRLDLVYGTWWSNTCNCQQYGITTTISGRGDGDSGGPIWNGNYAVALHANSSNDKAKGPRIEDLLVLYSVSMRTS